MILVISKSQKHFTAQQEELGNMGGHIEEIYSGHTVVKAYNNGEIAKQEFDAINTRLGTSVWKAQFLSGLMSPVMSFIGNLGYVAVCVVGAVLALNGSISFGVIVAFMMCVRFFTQPLQQIAQVATSLQQAAAATKQVFEFLEEKELSDESHKDIKLKKIQGNVQFQNVCFGYDKDRIIINDFSADVQAGQKVAIVGPTGAGKTTLVNVLMRFYELNGGRILLDGTAINNITREDLHRQFGMVLQDTWIFKGSIRDNIVYNTANVSEEQVISACKAVGLHRFVASLPQGYNTVLDDSVSLSVGQRQLITIARAMVQDAPLLILDEATSSIDTRMEAIIQKAMDELAQGRTSFVIAHRLSTIRNADIILVMKDGDIIESGNHEALIAKGGFYAELYNSQFEQAS
ncbi:MAG: ABC transporter ATP-binding protein [Oscillospiraceae bacterium]